MLNRILGWSRAAKRMVVVAMDICLGVIAMWLAFTPRLETPHWPSGMQWLAYALAPALAFPIFAKLGLYRAIFRYTGITALITTGKAVAIYGALLLGCLLAAQWEGVPRSVGILQPLLFMLLVGASRALGWLALAGRSINGVRVHASNALPEVVRRLGITDVLLALPSTTRERRRQIIESLRELPVRIRTLPGLSDLASGRVTVTDFQDLEIEDLLGREPVAPDPGLLGRNLAGTVVLVTGAGGSIGSELCRQIVREGPCQLLLVDHSEYALYSIHHELAALAHQGEHECALVPLLASVTHKARMADICRQYRPTSIYHAAAPPAGASPTRLSMVRFGNVLGSSGSVIPLFRKQIAAGGPLTVTHPDVTRYFMTIAEGAQLVLQAGAMAEGGDVFLLDMGEPLQILELAERMVALSGLTVRDDLHPEGDIEIVFTGLRPGEKLFEELLIGDNPFPTDHPRILRAREEYRPWEELQTLLQALQKAAHAGDPIAMTALLRQLVPGYHPETQPVLP